MNPEKFMEEALADPCAMDTIARKRGKNFFMIV